MSDNLLVRKQDGFDPIINKERNKALDCYKGVLIVLVVLGHILNTQFQTGIITFCRI